MNSVQVWEGDGISPSQSAKEKARLKQDSDIQEIKAIGAKLNIGVNWGSAYVGKVENAAHHLEDQTKNPLTSDRDNMLESIRILMSVTAIPSGLRGLTETHRLQLLARLRDLILFL